MCVWLVQIERLLEETRAEVMDPNDAMVKVGLCARRRSCSVSFRS